MASATCATPRTTTAWEWQATGTRWRIHHSGGVDAATAARVAEAVEQDEARWSRFRADGELSLLNRRAGDPVSVSDETFDLLEACLRWQHETEGVFQPLVGRALEAWGYAASLGDRGPHAERSPRRRPVEGVLELDRSRRAARVPAGASLDLGGIAKGWMAGRAAELLRRLSHDGLLLVDAGGDLVAARGRHLVAVERPDAPGAEAAWIRLAAGRSVATSGCGRRRWVNGDGVEAHHLIDPATGAPGVPAQATVVAADAAAADVLAKTLALQPDRIDRLSLPALVTAGGETRSTAAWRRLVVA